VTNVNTISIVTGKPPREHGITSNYWRNPATGTWEYMESAQYVLCPTMGERANKMGLRSAVLVAKDKLLAMAGRGATWVVSAEHPPIELTDAVGPPPPIYSAEVSLWLLRALEQVLTVYHPDVAFLSTTDYPMHRWAPGTREARAFIEAVDMAIGRILESIPDLELFITADHGMQAKQRGIDLRRILADEDIEAEFVPIIRDRYVVHHDNLGGAAYIYLRRLEDAGPAAQALLAYTGVEEVYGRDEAASKFALHPQRIGDLFVLGAADVVFGEFDSPSVPVQLRSHGSRYEARVPMIVRSSRVPLSALQHNYEILDWMLGDITG
jgi:phosphonoacetate hydrolase